MFYTDKCWTSTSELIGWIAICIRMLLLCSCLCVVIVYCSEDQPYVYKDAMFISAHKFIGGPSSPGILAAKKNLFKNPVPANCGGGTVFFVRREHHTYLKEVGYHPFCVYHLNIQWVVCPHTWKDNFKMFKVCLQLFASAWLFLVVVIGDCKYFLASVLTSSNFILFGNNRRSLLLV